MIIVLLDFVQETNIKLLSKTRPGAMPSSLLLETAPLTDVRPSLIIYLMTLSLDSCLTQPSLSVMAKVVY